MVAEAFLILRATEPVPIRRSQTASSAITFLADMGEVLAILRLSGALPTRHSQIVLLAATELSMKAVGFTTLVPMVQLAPFSPIVPSPAISLILVMVVVCTMLLTEGT